MHLSLTLLLHPYSTQPIATHLSQQHTRDRIHSDRMSTSHAPSSHTHQLIQSRVHRDFPCIQRGFRQHPLQFAWIHASNRNLHFTPSPISTSAASQDISLLLIVPILIEQFISNPRLMVHSFIIAKQSHKMLSVRHRLKNHTQRLHYAILHRVIATPIAFLRLLYIDKRSGIRKKIITPRHVDRSPLPTCPCSSTTLTPAISSNVLFSRLYSSPFRQTPNISDERNHGSGDLQQIEMHTASNPSLHAYNNDGFALM